MSGGKRDLTGQWLDKAESDWKTVHLLMKDADCPHDVVCFHCQQHVEKLLKALLTQQGIESPRTHDLRRLIQLSEPFAPELSAFLDEADALSTHGVSARYPDDYREIGAEEAETMVDLARRLRHILKPRLDA